ncbi:MAG: 50S ribosomal protein L15 [Candidatus Moranbacteria bacterium]|nr:50S ribosomal protein L15 [Candidatus Moranbacteria bacterium]
MQINTLKVNAKKKRKTIGRGGRKGTYSGRGNKGQKARTGAHIDPLFEGGRSTLIDHMKKKRGFTSRQIKPVAIQFSLIEKKMKDGETITLESLMKVGIIDKIKAPKVKIIGRGETQKKFTFSQDILMSQSAKKSFGKSSKKIEKKEKK